MNLKELKSRMFPFKPVTIGLDSGHNLFVCHEDYIFFPPFENSEIIIIVEESGGLHIVDVEHINRLEYNIITKT